MVFLNEAMLGLSSDAGRAAWALAFQSHHLERLVKTVGQGKGEGASGDFPSPALPLQPSWQAVFRDQTGRQAVYPGHGERIALAVSGRRHHPKQMSLI